MIGEKGSNIVNRKFFKNHVILSQCSCFIAENVLNSSKFFWNLTVSGQGSFHLLVIVNFPREYNFGKIEIDSQTDGNYTGKQKNLSEQIQHPVLSETSRNNDDDSQNDHEKKQYFGKVIEFSISSSHFGPGFVCIHDTSHLPSWVNDNSVCLSIGQEAISPQSVLQIETFSAALVLRSRLNFEKSLEIINVEFGCLSIDSGQKSQKTVLVVVFEVVMSEVYGLSQFPIRFTIELISPDENSPVLLTCGENDHISWNSLIRLNFNKLAHLDIFAQNGSSARFLNESVFLIVGLIISFLSVDIIVSFLKESKTEDQKERCDISKEKANFEHVNQLAECNQ